MSKYSVQGQDKALRLLARAREHGRLAHAYLFTGPDGCGKRTLAREFAQALLCPTEKAPTDAGCGHCPSCLQMESGNHPDFMVIEPDGQGIRIDAIRAMKEALGYPPLESSQRVVLLHNAHTMQEAAANSLLKILEEPPPGNILLLTADDNTGMLDTIRSRCQPIKLHALPLPLAATVLRGLNPGLDQNGALELARLANGCPGRALLLDEELLLLYRETVRHACGMQGAPAVRALSALELAVRLAERKAESNLVLGPLIRLVQDARLARLGARPAPADADNEAALAALREGWNVEQLSAKIAAIERAGATLAGNCNPTLVFETLLLELVGLLSPERN